MSRSALSYENPVEVNARFSENSEGFEKSASSAESVPARFSPNPSNAPGSPASRDGRARLSWPSGFPPASPTHATARRSRAPVSTPKTA